MRPSRALATLAGQADRRLEYLRSLSDLLPTNPDRTHDRIAAFVVIEGLNAWGGFARSFYLSCVFRATRTNGMRVTLGKSAHIADHAQAIDFAVRTIRGAKYVMTRKPPWGWRDEPLWHDPKVIGRLSPLLAFSNLPQIQAAFGLKTPVFSELPTFRNFFSHRNEDTADRVRSLITSNYKGYGFSVRTHATRFLCSVIPGRPQNILADYVDDLRNVIALMPH